MTEMLDKENTTRHKKKESAGKMSGTFFYIFHFPIRVIRTIQIGLRCGF